MKRVANEVVAMEISPRAGAARRASRVNNNSCRCKQDTPYLACNASHVRLCPASKPRRPRAKRPRLPTPRLSLQLQLRVHEAISSGLPPLPRTVEMQRAGIGLYNKLRSGVFLSNVAARRQKHWTRGNGKIALIKWTALQMNSSLCSLRYHRI